MRNRTLHSILETFTADAACQLVAEIARGAEVPFEVIEERRGRVPLYCYRPLTDSFIAERLGLLAALPSYAPASQSLASLQGLDEYLSEQGVTPIPSGARERADAALQAFLATVYDDRSEFELDQDRFEKAYADLERAVYDGRCMTTVIAPLLGLALAPASAEVPLGDGLSLMRGEAFADAPADAVWLAGEQPNALLVLSVDEDRASRSAISIARVRFHRFLTALRLFESGGYALGPVAWSRTDTGSWRTVALGGSGRPRFVTTLAREHEDELRAFASLLARRVSGSGEIAWALARFEMGCERLAPFEALTDYLLALRALLEPEGPNSGRLAGRLAAICARPADRPALAVRVAHAISLEHAVISGLAPAEPGVDALVDEMAEHLRALLRDVVCGHLEPDLCALADDLLAEGEPNRDGDTDEHAQVDLAQEVGIQEPDDDIAVPDDLIDDPDGDIAVPDEPIGTLVDDPTAVLEREPAAP